MNNAIKYVKKTHYNLHPQTIAYLQSQGLQPTDYRSCFGTALQHQLHTEFRSIVQTASSFEKNAFHHSNLIRQAVLFADAGVATNKAEFIDLAVHLANTSHGFMGIILDIGNESNRLLGIAAHQAVESLVKLPETTIHGIVALYDFLDFIKDQVCHRTNFDNFENIDEAVAHSKDRLNKQHDLIISILQEISHATLD